MGSTVVDPGGGSDEGRLFSPDLGGRVGAMYRRVRVGDGPTVRFRPQIWPESATTDGRNLWRAAAEGGGERARAEMSLPPTASLWYGAL